ncbi:MAG: signal recognition particle protein [Planctomycetes bacterium]|nr:signal recognition particle protein [Planctomycetota bacterium]
MFESLTQRLSNAFSFFKDKKEITPDNIDEALGQVRTALLEADVHFKVAREFTDRVKSRVLGAEKLAGVEPGQQFVHACHKELVDLMGPEGAELAFAKSGPTVILMAGLQGAGKTTTCGKLAKLLRERFKKRPLLVAADVKRPAAVDQLKVLGARLSLPVFHAAGLAAPEVCARGVEEAKKSGADVVILDTAGRLHVDEEMMAEVAEIARRCSPHAQLLVVDAMTGQDAVRSAQAFHERLQLTGVILTKLDGDARGGAALSIKQVTSRPILFVGTGEKLEDLDPFHPERMAGRILGMGDVVGLVETAASKISEDEARASYEKMVLGEFTLEDMLAQLRMIKRLGPMKKVLGMLPGVGSMVENLDVDDRKLVRMEALFTSMTPKERLHPELLDMSRRRRIARGSGQEVDAVNELLKGFKGMKQMMKEMNRLGLGAKLGADAKKQALREMSPTGELAAGSSGGGGLLGGLGALGSGLGSLGSGIGGLFGGGSKSQPSLEDLRSMMGGGPRPVGSSPQRRVESKKDKKARRKRGRR